MSTNISESEEDLFWRPFGRLVISLLFISVFFSCTKKKTNNVNIRSNSHVSNQTDILKEAKHIDIPIPVGYKFVALPNNSDIYNNSEFLCYYGQIPLKQLLHYYKTNLERCGWEIIDLSNDYEGLFFCDKPGKYCVISVRNNVFEVKNEQKNNYVCLFIKNKGRSSKHREQNFNSRGFSLLNFS
ncbi:hypothetical protein GF322_03700 [Candidatus Dependentiae bacterium]|nr:hypothetical protein [Candidatus Dependentiae bacterium]